MTGSPEKQNPAVGRGFGYDVNPDGHDRITDALEVFRAAHGGKFTRSGKGWRANCPCCDDRKAAMSATERDGWLHVHCFKCGAPRVDILRRVGLRLSDVGPPRTWPESPEDRRQARRAIREAGWSAALAILAREATVVTIAAADLIADKAIEWDDYVRLVAAGQRIDNAANVLVEAAQWRPEVRQ
jgi:hypothetical protein